ncbi:hypothetical protein AB0C97_28435 [Streptomyces goshikiensis]|uniref:hypothetical protein n=1 Tax=Streptomyces goshikiensis TaxID=1942 RepID=UPI0033E85BCF
MQNDDTPLIPDAASLEERLDTRHLRAEGGMEPFDADEVYGERCPDDDSPPPDLCSTVATRHEGLIAESGGEALGSTDDARLVGVGAVIEVMRHGAFSVNGVGVECRPFPLSFSLREVEGVWKVAAGAAQACEVADLLVAVANDAVAVVSLESNSYLDEEWRTQQPSLIAAELGVPCRVHPLGSWASGTYGLGEELVLMDRDQLPRLLDDTLSPYELTLIDLPSDATPEQLDELALVLGTTGFDEPLLNRLEGSEVWFSGHDDCYVLLETRDPALPAAVLARLLALLAGSALGELTKAPTSRVPEPGSWLAERLIAMAPHWIGVLGGVSEELVTIELAALPEPWRLGVPFAKRADLTATLDVRHGTWRIASAGWSNP